MSKHNTRENIEKKLFNLRSQGFDSHCMETLAHLQIELLLDIRDLLQESNQKQGIAKWGPKT